MKGWITVLAVLALGCQEEADEEPAPQAPEAVAPVEVTGDEAEATAEGEDELTQLRARVAELEGQLAQCGCETAEAESGTESVAIPEGEAPEAVEVPEGEEAPAEAATASNRTGRDTATTRRDRDREPTLLGTLLGDEEEAERERRRVRRQARSGSSTNADDETIQLPNPARVLLGE